MTLEGKTAVVTGAGRGLGRAIARAMAEAGAHVVLFSRTESELLSAAREIHDAGGRSLVYPGDVSHPPDVSGMIDTAMDQFSGVDILVNNAAVIGPPGFIQDADIEAWTRTLDVNLTGAALCARTLAPHMAEKGYGKIISISSGLGEKGFPIFCAYSVSKAGVIQLTRALAEELNPSGIRVNALDPGVMDTSMQERIRELGPEKLGRRMHENFVSLKEEGNLRDPREAARAAVFLASSRSDGLTGVNGSLEDYRRLGWEG